MHSIEVADEIFKMCCALCNHFLDADGKDLPRESSVSCDHNDNPFHFFLKTTKFLLMCTTSAKILGLCAKFILRKWEVMIPSFTKTFYLKRVQLVSLTRLREELMFRNLTKLLSEKLVTSL